MVNGGPAQGTVVHGSADSGTPGASSDATGDTGVDALTGDGASNAEAGHDAPQVLFDGSSTAAWRMAGNGSFSLEGNALVAQPGDGLGLYWCTIPTPPDFVLTLEWKRAADDDNSGIFLRFPDPNGKGYDNTAWVGVNFGFEVQIDEHGQPDGAPEHTTGAIYTERGQTPPRKLAKAVGEWNTYEIRVEGTSYTVALNGDVVTTWSYSGDPDPAHPGRGLPSTASEPRYIGVQSHTGHVAFRNVVLRAIARP